MPSGHAVLCDFRNASLKLLDTSFKLVDRFPITYPWDVSLAGCNDGYC